MYVCFAGEVGRVVSSVCWCRGGPGRREESWRSCRDAQFPAVSGGAQPSSRLPSQHI